MSRKGPVKKRKINPDPKYQSILVAKFVNKIMKKGKKNLAYNIVYKAFNIISEKTKKEPLEVFEQAIRNASPSLEVRSRRIGGATYQIPVEVRGDRKLTLASRWIIKASRTKKGQTMWQKLAEEIIAAYNNTGEAIASKDKLHKSAEANRAFAHLARY